MYYLYIKKHNVTNLQYLGYTSSSDPHKYTGSGTYWIRHLKKHGFDYKTQILLATTDIDDIRSTGVFFSTLFGVVKSSEWANLKIENLDGGWDYVNANISDARREQLRNIGRSMGIKNKNTVSVRDSSGKVFRVPIDDARISRGELVGSTKNTVTLYDTQGNKIRSNTSDSLNQNLHGNNYGKVFITNGVNNKMIARGSEIPEGWILGVSETKNKHNKGKMWINNGVEEKMVYKDIPFSTEWKRGRVKKI